MLKYIHITKTGGTSVENFYIKKGIKYGRFDEDFRKNCVPIPSNEWWHSILPDDCFLWGQYEFFTIIRDPIDRLISEYYYGKTKPIKKENVEIFNQKFYNQLIYVQQTLTSSPKRTGHWFPQINSISIKHLDKIHLLDFNRFTVQVPELHNSSTHIKNHDLCNIDKKQYLANDLDEKNKTLIKQIYITDYNLYNLVQSQFYINQQKNKNIFDAVFYEN